MKLREGNIFTSFCLHHGISRVPCYPGHQTWAPTLLPSPSPWTSVLDTYTQDITWGPTQLWIWISLCIRIRFWMVSEGLPTPYIADGWCRKTFWHHRNQHRIWFWMVSEDLPTSSKIWFWRINWFGFEVFQNPPCLVCDWGQGTFTRINIPHPGWNRVHFLAVSQVLNCGPTRWNPASHEYWARVPSTRCGELNTTFPCWGSSSNSHPFSSVQIAVSQHY